MDWARTRWSRLGVGQKVVAPFVGLTLIVGLAISALASQQLAASGAQQLQTIAVREQDNVNTLFNSIEERQLADLRVLSATEGVADAVAAGDTATLSRLVLPIVANHLPEMVTVSVVKANGDSLLQLQADPAHPDQCLCSPGVGKASFAHLDDVLQGRADSYGTRYVGLVGAGATQLLYTIGPLIDSNGYLTGAILVGETVDQILGLVEDRAHIQASLFTADGIQLATTPHLDFAIPPLGADERGQIVQQSGIISKRVNASGHQASVFYIPWVMRFQAIGYAALIVPADAVVSAQTLVLGVILIACLGALMLTLVVASIVTRSITRPMNELIRGTSQIAAGNLEHHTRVDSQDEIGRLAASFNEMTAALREKTHRIEKLTDETIVALAATIDARDPYTHGHSMRVSTYADAIAALCGFSDAERDAVRRGCTVHDIGKIGVPDSILRKTGPLEHREWNVMRQHPVVGYRLVSGLPWDRTVLDIVLHHHERWDGHGYPAGLTGDAIPRSARIVAIADTLDALTSRRPYRPAHTFRRSVDEIIAQAGAQFDAELVAIVKTHRRELAAMVTNALHMWVPRVYRNRRQRTLAESEGQLEVMSL